MRSAAAAMLVCDRDGIVLAASRGRDDVAALAAGDLIGRSIVDALPEAGGREREEIARALRDGVAVEFVLAVRGRNVRVTALPSDGGLVVLAHRPPALPEAAPGHDVRREAASHTSILLDVAHDLSATLDAEEILQRVQRRMASVLPCDMVTSFRWDEAAARFRLASEFGTPAEMLSVLSRASFGPTEPYDGLLYQGPVLLNDPRSGPPAIAGLARSFGISAMISAPLRVPGRYFGAMSACRLGTAAPFDERHVELCTAIAGQVGVALERARIIHELDAANRLKSEFVAMMSHELRTPLNAIIGYGDLLREGAFGNVSPPQADALDCLQRSSRELLHLIGDVLDLSRLDGGRPLRLGPVSIADLLAELEGELRPLQRSGAVALRFAIGREVARIVSDAAKLKVVLRNLLTNALKFTERGAIDLTASPDRGGVAIAVADTGIGIPADRLGQIFEPFRQAHAASRPKGGVGLGLYIVRRIVDMLGGTIAVESRIGEGSVFRVWLPATDAAVPVASPFARGLAAAAAAAPARRMPKGD